MTPRSLHILAIIAVTALLASAGNIYSQEKHNPWSIEEPSFESTSSNSDLRIGLNISPKTFKKEARALQALNIKTIRIPMQWGSIEKKQGQFDWTRPDKLVRWCWEHNVRVVFTLRSISPWGTVNAAKQTSIYRSGSIPKDPKSWRNFLTTMVERYKGRGVIYEIENEVNGKAFWSSSLDDYLSLLKFSYEIIKKTDPQALVLHAAMGSGITKNISGNQGKRAKEKHNSWLKAILMTKAFDVVNVHSYYYPSKIIVNGLTFQKYLKNIHKLMDEAGVNDKSIWITECGYNAHTAQVGKRTDQGSPETQAAFLKQAYTQAKAMNVKKMFWLILKDRNEPFFGTMGILDKNGKKRNALYQTILQINRK